MLRKKISDDKVEEILKLVADGNTQREVADKLGLALSTVNRYSKSSEKSQSQSSKNLERLCEIVLEKIKDDLKKNNKSEEEEDMSDDVETKVQQVLNQREVLNKLNELSGLKSEIEALKANQHGLSDLCKKFPGLCQTVDETQEEVKKLRSQQELYCDPKSGQCFLTKAEFERFMNEQNAKIPQILGGHQDLSSLFRHLTQEKDEKLDEAIQGRIPPELKARWIGQWCTDPECVKLLEGKGIKIRDTADERAKGILGVRR